MAKRAIVASDHTKFDAVDLRVSYSTNAARRDGIDERERSELPVTPVGAHGGSASARFRRPPQSPAVTGAATSDGARQRCVLAELAALVANLVGRGQRASEAAGAAARQECEGEETRIGAAAAYAQKSRKVGQTTPWHVECRVSRDTERFAPRLRSLVDAKESSMRNAAVWSIGGLSVLLLSLGACHQGRGARNGHAADRDRELDEHRVADRDRDVDEHHDEGAKPELGAGLSTGSAVRSIASARCEREKRCDNIGTERKFASEGACEEKIRAEWSGDLNKYECPRGIVKAELEECLNDIRAEDCGNPFDTLARIAQCDASDICDGD